VWSNDKYESVEHRAVANTKRERFSIPLFFFPGDLDEQREVFVLTKEKSSWAASQLDLAPRSERGFPQRLGVLGPIQNNREEECF
ncbi:gibberellin 20 oxidase 1-like protein, partial [Trifolium pratense]